MTCWFWSWWWCDGDDGDNDNLKKYFCPQTEAHLGKNKQKPAEFLFSGHTWDWQVAAW